MISARVFHSGQGQNHAGKGKQKADAYDRNKGLSDNKAKQDCCNTADNGCDSYELKSSLLKLL